MPLALRCADQLSESDKEWILGTPPVKYWPGPGPLDILPFAFSPELDRLDEIGMLIKDWQPHRHRKKENEND